MNYHSNGRNQRPSKGLMLKRALQFSLLLAVCIWLLYQIKNSHNKSKDYGGSVQNKPSEEPGTMFFGRKGNVGLSSDGVIFGSEKLILEGEGKMKEDGGVGDDELDGNPKEKAEDEIFHKGNEYVGGNSKTREWNEVGDNGQEPEIPYKASRKNEESNSDQEARGKGELDKDLFKEENTAEGRENLWGSVLDHDEQRDEKDFESQISLDEQGDDNVSKAQVNRDVRGDDKDPERQVQEPQNNEEIKTDTLIREEDEAAGSSKENDETKDLEKSEGVITMPSIGTVPGRSEMEDEVHGFHDENGVPPGGNYRLKSTLTQSRDDQEDIPHQETILNSNNQSKISESALIEVEVASKLERRYTDVELKNRSTVGGSISHPKSDSEINSETSVHTDSSSINLVAETRQDKFTSRRSVLCFFAT